MPGIPRRVADYIARLLAAHRRRVKEVNQRSFLRRALARGTQNTHIWLASMMIVIERRSAPNAGSVRVLRDLPRHSA
jgi:hypothetical protein